MNLHAFKHYWLITPLVAQAVRTLPHALALALVARACTEAPSPFAWVGACFLALPVADWLIGQDVRTPQLDGALATCVARWLPWCWMPLHVALLSASLELVRSSPTPMPTAFSLGVPAGMLAGAFGMSAAHELMHRRGTAARWGAGLLLTLSGYAHFRIAHLQGHHRLVGTPADYATAKFGQSLYAFVPRSIAGGVQLAWRHELLRLSRSRGWARRNRVVTGLFTFSAYAIAATLFAGAEGLVFLLCQAVVAVAVLECVNYIQHYGLVVAPAQDGSAANHTWDCRFRVTNLLLFNLGRHAAHHGGGCSSSEDAPPTLPTGYFACFILALLPPLWMQVMDPRAARALERAVPHAATSESDAGSLA